MVSECILVIGGAGYIGSHVCKELYMKNYCPITFDNLSTGHKNFVKWGPFEEGDILDTHKLEMVLKKYRPNCVMHFAAKTLVHESMVEQDLYKLNNIDGTKSVIKALKSLDIKNFIFSSTAAVYGNKNQKITESNSLKPTSFYGKTKLDAENLIKKELSNHRYIILRYFNAAGADPDLEIGEFHNPETHLIPTISENIIKNKVSKIFGNDFDTKDGTCIRDFIHVKDIALAHIKSMEYLFRNDMSHIFNIGNGKGYSIFDVIKKFESITKKKLRYKICDRREGDPPKLVANNEQFSKVIKMNVKNSSLEQIIKTDFEWRKKLLRS